MSKESKERAKNIIKDLLERKEQLTKHKWTIAQDVINNSNQEFVITVYALLLPNPTIEDFPQNWRCSPFVPKMIKKEYRQRVIIAGALLAAEIDRIDFEEQFRNI